MVGQDIDQTLPQGTIARSLEVDLLGGFQVRVSGQLVDIPKEKARCIIALLVLNAPYGLSREVLRGLLWTGSSERAAQNSLRNALWGLRHALENAGFYGLQASRSEVWLDGEQAQTDMETYLAALADGNVEDHHINARKTVDSLADTLKGTDLFQERLEHYRNRFAKQIDTICRSGLAENDDPARQISILSVLLSLNPLDESTCQSLIRLYVQTGQTANALACYQALWNRLDEEFGEEPSRETQDLIIALKSTPQSEGGAGGSGGGAKPRILVARPHWPHLSDAQALTCATLRDSVLVSLTRFREWRILDEAVLDPTVPLARPPEYRLSLTASPTDGQSLLCSAVLTDLSSGELLWSERFPDPTLASGRLGVDATRNLAVSLNLHLSSSILPSAAETLVNTYSQYERWLLAQRTMQQFTAESWQRAEGILDDLIAENPDFVRALSSRASIETMRHLSFPGVYSDQTHHQKALRWASKAIQTDPLDSRAQLAMAWSCAMSRQFERAKLAFDLAFKHNENDPWTIVSAAVGFAFCDETQQAQDYLEFLAGLSISLQPVHWSYVAATHFMCGDLEASIAASARSDRVSYDVSAWHAAALGLLGRISEAEEEGQQFLSGARGAWHGPQPVRDADILRWIISGFPIRNRDTWLRLRDGLIAARLPAASQIG